MSSLEKCYLDLLPTFWFVFSLSCMSCLFWRLIPLGCFVCKYFLPFCYCLFILFMVSFAVQKLLILIRFQLFTFVFTFITLDNGSKKIFLSFMLKYVQPLFSLKSFIVSDFTVRSLIRVFVLLWLCVCVVLENILIYFFSFSATLAVYESSWARDWIQARAVTCTTASATPDI